MKPRLNWNESWNFDNSAVLVCACLCLVLAPARSAAANKFFNAWGASQTEEATRLVDICLEAGLNMFDSADIYSDGRAEEVLAAAIGGRRDSVLISTKATFRAGEWRE